LGSAKKLHGETSGCWTTKLEFHSYKMEMQTEKTREEVEVKFQVLERVLTGLFARFEGTVGRVGRTRKKKKPNRKEGTKRGHKVTK